jgi:hypothetical protein
MSKRNFEREEMKQVRAGHGYVELRGKISTTVDMRNLCGHGHVESSIDG